MVWIGISACAMRASAHDPEALRVERGPGAETCPDAAELGARVEAIRGQASAAGRTYSVAFAREGHVFSAQLRSDADSSSLRSLESRADDCRALAQASAVTLALLFDADVSPREPTAPEPAPAPPPAIPASATMPEPQPSAAEASTERQPLQLGIAVGAGLAAAVLRPWAPAVLAELGLRGGALRFGLGGVWIPEQQLELAPGASKLSLIAASARGCYTPFRRRWLRIEACSGLLLGSLAAAATGYTRDAASNHHVFAALPIELTLGQGLTHASWELSATLLIPYRRNQFEIDGLGDVYETPAVSALLSLRATGWFSL
jgi:hypothetical protein